MKYVVLLVVLLLTPSQLLAQTRSKSLNDTNLRSTEDSLEKIELLTREDSQKKFLENEIAFGGTFGTPGGLNFIAEGYYHYWGLRLEAGALPLFPLALLAGWQTDLNYVIQSDRNSLFEFTAIFMRSFNSSFDEPGYGTTGIGAGIAVSAGGFFFEIGAGHTWHYDVAYSVPQDPKLFNSLPMVIQVGYVH